jgi:hypothetical protein
MATDAKAIRELIDGKLALPSYPLTLTKDDLRKMKINRASGAARNAILCLLAPAKRKHFVTGADISLAKDHFSEFKDPNAHHIFPEELHKEGPQTVCRRGSSLTEFLFPAGGLKQQNQRSTTFRLLCRIQG